MKTNKNSKTHTRAAHLSQSELAGSDTNTRSKKRPTMPSRISYERWLVKYRPIKNHLVTDAPFDGLMFETYGTEVEFVCAQPAKKIWTLFDCEGKIRLVEGFHFVDRLGYFISVVEAPDDRYFSIKAD